MRISDWSSDVCSSDLQGHGITRLWKALRHETPDPAVTAARLVIPDGSSLAASVIRTYHAQHTGKMSIARLGRGSVKDGDSLGSEKVSGLYRLMGGADEQETSAGHGEVRTEEPQAALPE